MPLFASERRPSIGPVSQPDRAVRASDAEREDVSRQLSAHAAAGRLTPEELDERLDAAYAARTHGELTRLLEDLPAAPAPRAEDPARAVARTRLAHRAGAAAIVSLLCVGIWAAAGASGSFWPIWVILLAAVGLAREGWRTLGPGRDAERRGARRAPAAGAGAAVAARDSGSDAAVPLAGGAAGANSITEGKGGVWRFGARVVVLGVCASRVPSRVFRNTLWRRPRRWALLLPSMTGGRRAHPFRPPAERCCGRRAKCARTPRPRPAGAAADARAEPPAARPPPLLFRSMRQ